ncbi:Phage gp6-like head-tail connector protein [Lentilactobacillus parabuchneri]|uniref:phage head-tail connector protein n=1 Tax=Lentilactobacillus parabuchneri TaxID=152331 RepID=UPI000A220AD1|nr:phage head-tail connector protein [Lentilactobacillus parabuchneri]ORN39596.1 Phage gp6-like head-tail connector protein [Lentilactobacillus parabuchneri]
MADQIMPTSLLTRLGVQPNSDDAQLVNDLYSDAVTMILDYTHRDVLVGNMATYAKQLAVIVYNRLDTEGESSRSEGNISRSFITDIPEDIQRPLMRYRVASFKGLSQ